MIVVQRCMAVLLVFAGHEVESLMRSGRLVLGHSRLNIGILRLPLRMWWVMCAVILNAIWLVPTDPKSCKTMCLFCSRFDGKTFLSCKLMHQQSFTSKVHSSDCALHVLATNSVLVYQRAI